MTTAEPQAEDFNRRGEGHLPGHLGLVFTHVAKGEARCEMPVRTELMAINGFLHAASIVAKLTSKK